MQLALVINDDHAFRRAIVSWLKERNWSVLESEDGPASLELGVKHKPQLVLCDLLMPRCNGFHLCREFRRHQDQGNPATIIATGNGYATDRINALEAGADEYMGRPMDFEKFGAALSRHNGTPAALGGAGDGGEKGTRLKFWGVRGSIPTPGMETVFYGGNTSCVEVRVNGEIIILDAGSGIRKLGQALGKEFKDRPMSMNVLITHTHWDHIQGFPFFMPAYDPKNDVTIFGFEGARQGLQSTLSSQMESPYFPISMQQMPGNITIQEVKGLNFKVGNVPVQAQFLNHPGACTGYRLETPAGAISYLPDVELFQRLRSKAEIDTELLQPEDRKFSNEQDRKVVEFIHDSEILILDAQYNAHEYQKHIGWGHSCAEDSVAFALKAKVRRLFLFHHDPDHDDEEISRMVSRARQIVANRGSSLIVEAAREGFELVMDSVGKK